jgi:hypothetical protein
MPTVWLVDEPQCARRPVWVPASTDEATRTGCVGEGLAHMSVIVSTGRRAPDPIAEQALALVSGPADEAVDELVALVGGQREPLVGARDALVGRLHRRSDDFDATKALRLVSRALARVGW